MNMTATLAELGMDSLMGAEIKQALERNFDTVLSVGDIRNLTMTKLLELQGGSAAATASSGAAAAPSGAFGTNDQPDAVDQQVCEFKIPILNLHICTYPYSLNTYLLTIINTYLYTCTYLLINVYTYL